MAAAPRRGVLTLLKHGWNEIPDVVGTGILATGALFAGIGALIYYEKIDGDNRRYRDTYTVIRHDDPRAEKLRKDYLGDK